MALPDLDSLLRAARRAPVWRSGPDTRALDLHGDAIFALLPHRAPFLFVERVWAADATQRAIAATRRIDPADPVFAGHFPGNPVYPGVLLVETMAQVASCIEPVLRPGEPTPARFATVRAVFLAPVLPGDGLEIRARAIGEYDGLYSRAIGQVLRGDTVCAAAVLEAIHVG